MLQGSHDQSHSLWCHPLYFHLILQAHSSVSSGILGSLRAAFPCVSSVLGCPLCVIQLCPVRDPAVPRTRPDPSAFPAPLCPAALPRPGFVHPNLT